jgi:hypothetical protein
LDAHDINKGLSLKAYTKVLRLFGYLKYEDLLATNVFHMMTGVVKDIHRAPNAPFYNPDLSVDQLKVLVMAIHNLSDPEIFKHQFVFPEALNNLE